MIEGISASRVRVSHNLDLSPAIDVKTGIAGLSVTNGALATGYHLTLMGEVR